MKIIILTLLMTPTGTIVVDQTEKPLPVCVWRRDAEPKFTPCTWKKGVITYDKQRKTFKSEDK